MAYAKDKVKLEFSIVRGSSGDTFYEQCMMDCFMVSEKAELKDVMAPRGDLERNIQIGQVLGLRLAELREGSSRTTRSISKCCS